MQMDMRSPGAGYPLIPYFCRLFSGLFLASDQPSFPHGPLEIRHSILELSSMSFFTLFLFLGDHIYCKLRNMVI